MNSNQPTGGERGLRITIVGVNYGPEPTGIAPYTVGVAHGLQQRGHQVRVVTTYPHYPQWKVERDSEHLNDDAAGGVDVTRLRHYVPSRPTGLRRLASEVSFAIGASIQRWGRPDVVLCPSPALFGAVAVEVRRSFGWVRPAVGVIAQDLYSAGITEIAGPGAVAVSALTAVERHALGRADGVVAIHERFRARMVEHLGVEPSRITVIRNWTHVARAGTFDRAALRASLGWGGDEFIVLHTGAMGEKQALSNVIDAARRADETKVRVRFVLTGDGGQRPFLERHAAGVDRIDLLPPVPEEDYGRLLASADLLLVNERRGVSEMAVPSKLTSYFSSGVAVLAATSAGSTTAGEVAAAGAGVRVEPGDPQALLDAVLSCAADPDGTRRLGAQGPKYCETVLSERVSLDAYADWVETLAGSRTGAARG